MGRERYRLTIDGGHRVATSSLPNVAIEAVPILAKGRRVYVRCTDSDAVCVQFQRSDTGDVTVTATHHGSPTSNVPSWANQLRALLLV